LSPKFGFFKRITADNFGDDKKVSDQVRTISNNDLSQIVEKEKKVLEKDLIASLEPTRKLVLQCLEHLRKSADELEEQEIRVENPQFESLINTSKRILITSIKKESLIESTEIKNYEDAVKFKNNLELLINRFGQVGDSHNRILNEFMRKQLNKLKSEFDNLSSLLKDVSKIISIKENEINTCIRCKGDLDLLSEKMSERKTKQVLLSELREEREIIDKDIKEGKRKYEDFQKSEEFLKTSEMLGKIDKKKNEIAIVEKNMINMFSNLSRPITKFSYLASKETQGMLGTIQNHPLEIFDDISQYLRLFSELKKQVGDKSIQIKDPEKTIHLIDEIVDSLPPLSPKLKRLKEELNQLESMVNSKSNHYLGEIKAKTQMYEKNLSENISKAQETSARIAELDSIVRTLKRNIEDNLFEITDRKYSISQ
jgi:hypothetical protein